MARYRALPAATAPDPEPASAAVSASPGGSGGSRQPVLPPFDPGIDSRCYRQLEGLQLRVADHRFVTDALETARRLCCRGEPCELDTVKNRVSTVARYLVSESERVGQFDYRAAFRRANVDRYLDVMVMRRTPKSAKMLRSLLYFTARLVHPREYPQPRSPISRGVARTRAVGPGRVAELYRIAAALPAVHSRRLLLQLDLCYWAGARPRDLMDLRGSDISETSWNGDPVALIRLANQAGGTRIVPVGDPAASRRLLAAAAERPTQFLMTIGGGKIGRNTANKTSEYLIRRGHQGINAAELRHGWMVHLAQRVPAALLMQLADVKDIRVLAEQQDLLPTYGLQHAVTLIKETWQ